MRWLELIEGRDGKLDEQSALSIIFGLLFAFLEFHKVVIEQQPFDALGFAEACGAFLAGSLGMLTVRSRFSSSPPPPPFPAPSEHQE